MSWLLDGKGLRDPVSLLDDPDADPDVTDDIDADVLLPVNAMHARRLIATCAMQCVEQDNNAAARQLCEAIVHAVDPAGLDAMVSSRCVCFPLYALFALSSFLTPCPSERWPTTICSSRRRRRGVLPTGASGERFELC